MRPLFDFLGEQFTPIRRRQNWHYHPNTGVFFGVCEVPHFGEDKQECLSRCKELAGATFCGMLRRLLGIGVRQDVAGQEPPHKRSRKSRISRSSPSATVNAAKRCSDVFEDLNMPKALAESKLDSVQLRCSTGETLSESDRVWMLDSVRQNLQDMYDASEMKWNDVEKDAELRHPDQRFLIAHERESGERIAFLSYRWDVEEERAVMYVYEVSVAEKFRGNRIGFALMLYAERLCRAVGVTCIMLTVFLQNRAAWSLYRDKLKYVPT